MMHGVFQSTSTEMLAYRTAWLLGFHSQGFGCEVMPTTIDSKGFFYVFFIYPEPAMHVIWQSLISHLTITSPRAINFLVFVSP